MDCALYTLFFRLICIFIQENSKYLKFDYIYFFVLKNPLAKNVQTWKGVRRMAATKSNETTKLILKVQTGTTDLGNPVYASRTFSKFNPSIADADLLTIGEAMANLQKYPLASINRQDNSALAAE